MSEDQGQRPTGSCALEAHPAGGARFPEKEEGDGCGVHEAMDPSRGKTPPGIFQLFTTRY